MSRNVSTPLSLEIHLLGPFRVAIGGRAVEERHWSRRKPKLLVKLLALQPHHQLHREQLMEMLWPELDTEAAANNLYKTIHMARHALEPELKSAADSQFILAQGQQVILRARGELWVDVEAFERHAAEAIKHDSVEACEAALVLYKGDLLIEDPYEDWAATRREQLRRQYQDLLTKLAHLCEMHGEYERSIERLKDLIACDPSNEEVHRHLMLTYARTGNCQQALRQYQQCSHALHRELDAKPDRATMELRDRIVAGRIQPFPPSEVKRDLDGGKAINSLAILPLANSSADPNADYLSDGITESIINNLSQLRGLRVMARGTVFRYKGQEVDAQKVGQELHVRAVLTGRIIQLGDRLVIRTELIDTGDGSQLWGAQYNQSFSDVLAVQEEIAQQISKKLQLRLTGEERKLLTKRQTENTEAYQAYLKGRYYWNKRTEEGLKKAVEYFEQAVGKDPGYALAYAGLAESYALFSWYSVLPPKESFPKGKEAALKALAMDETLAEAHNAMAFIKQSYDWDWPGAEREYGRAIELNPGYATARQWFAIHLSAMGQHDEAVAEIRRAQELDPLSRVINRDVGWVLYWARRYDEAIEAYRKTIELDPNFYIAHYFFGETYEQAGRHREAIAEFRDTRTHAKEGTRVWTLLGHARAYALMGKKDEAQRVVNELAAFSLKHYVSPYLIAAVHVRLDEKERAFEWLEKAYRERDPYLGYLEVEPVLDSLRSDPRFRDLVRSVGLTP